MTQAAENTDGNSSSRKLTSAHLNQITVLRTLSPRTGTETRQLQINEISQISGLDDEKEVQRYLFILEGQKLVTPFPEGDFTSKTWKITRTGVRALKTIDKSNML